MNKSKGGVKYQSGRLAPCLGILESYGLCPSFAFSGYRGIDTIYVRPPGKRAVYCIWNGGTQCAAEVCGCRRPLETVKSEVAGG